MAKTANSVSALEAKTRLAELLRETERGRSFVIRRRGKAVARLVPVEPDRPVGFAAQLPLHTESMLRFGSTL